MRYGQAKFQDATGVDSVFHYDTPDRWKIGWNCIRGDSVNNIQPSTATGSCGTRPGRFLGAVQSCRTFSNLFPNPSFTSALTWTKGANLDVLEIVEEPWLWYTSSMRLYEGNSNGGTYEYADSGYQAVSGSTAYYVLLGTFRKTGTYPENSTPRIWVYEYNSGYGYLDSHYVDLDPGTERGGIMGGWEQHAIRFTSESTAAWIKIIIDIGLKSGESGELFVDGVNLVQDTAVHPFVGGSATSVVLKYPKSICTEQKGTVAFWVYGSEFTLGGFHYLIDARDGSHTEPFALYVNVGQVIGVYNYTPVIWSTTLLKPFQWYHIMLDYDYDTGDFLKLYINGKLEDDYFGSMTISGLGDDITIGAPWTVGVGSQGDVWISDLVFLDHPSTEEDRAALYGLNWFEPTYQKYGQVELSDKITWALEIDWDGDGLYSGDNEAFWLRDLQVRRGREYQVQSGGLGFEEVKEGQFRGTLLNLNHRYDPWEESSPLYPYVRPGPKFRIRVKEDDTGHIHPVIRGRLTDVRPNFSSDVNLVQIMGVERFEEFKNSAVYIDTQLGINTEDAIQMVLDEMDWDDGFSFENVPESIPYWWSSGDTVWRVMNDLANSSLGNIFIAADGKVKFYSRYHSSFGSPIATIQGNEILRQYMLNVPWDNLRNAILIKSNNRTPKFGQPLWQATEVFSVGPSKTLSLFVEYSHNSIVCAGKDVFQPAQYIDYTANTASDGNGSDLTTQVDVTLTGYGDRGILNIKNNSTSIAYMTLLKIRGTALVLDNVVAIQQTDPSSIELLGRREFRLDNPWIQNLNLAKSYSLFLMTLLPEFRKLPIITIYGQPHSQFGLDLFDEIDIENAGNLSGNYLIGEIEHTWQDTLGKTIKTTFRMEPAIPFAQYWTFTTQLDSTAIFAY